MKFQALSPAESLWKPGWPSPLWKSALGVECISWCHLACCAVSPRSEATCDDALCVFDVCTASGSKIELTVIWDPRASKITGWAEENRGKSKFIALLV